MVDVFVLFCMRGPGSCTKCWDEKYCCMYRLLAPH